MNNNQQFSLANRKNFIDLLADKPNSLRQRAKDRFRTKRHKLYDSYFHESAEKKGALKIADQITVTTRKLHELNAELKQLGFRFDYDDHLVIDDEDANPIEKLIDQRIEKEIGVSEDIDARFDSASTAIMTVDTLEEAQKLLKSVSV